MRGLNLDQMRTLIEVAELGSFSAAARRLNLTQPAISLQVRELERRFGVRLIERMGKRAHATAPGHDLIAAAHRIFRECDLANAAMRRFRGGGIGRVRIGSTFTGLMYELPPILRSLRLDYPGIELAVTNQPTRESVESIVQNRIDLALVTLPVRNKLLRVTPLRRDELVAIFPAGTRDVPDEVTPSYVAGQTLLMEHARGAVHALVMRWLSAHMPLPRTPMQLGVVEALKSAVASNLGMAIVPEVAVAGHGNDFIVRPLRPPVPCTLALIEHRNKPNESALEIVRNALLGLCANGEAARGPQPNKRGRLVPGTLRRAAARSKGERGKRQRRERRRLHSGG